MRSCHACARHVRDSERACPFCGASLCVAPAPGSLLVAAMLGLGLTACGDPGGGGGTDTAMSDVSGVAYGSSPPTSWTDSTGTSTDPTGNETSGSTTGQETDSTTATGSSGTAGSDTGTAGDTSTSGTGTGSSG